MSNFNNCYVISLHSGVTTKRTQRAEQITLVLAAAAPLHKLQFAWPQCREPSTHSLHSGTLQQLVS